MPINIKSTLFIFDLIGKNPQLFIFNNKRNKSIASSLISIIIMLLSITFAIFSLFDYLKYESPNIVYSKNNDEKTKRNFLKKDFLFMIQLVDTTTIKAVNKSVGYYVAEYIIYYNNGTNISIPMDIETCELGKNIDAKYNYFTNSQFTYGRNLKDFYCLSSKYENISLFYDPTMGFSIMNLHIVFNNKSNYTPEKIQSIIVTENNVINHYNKSHPISQGYIFQFTSAYSSLENTRIHYNLQYIKYETDHGFFFPKAILSYGMSFSDMTSYRNKRDNNKLIQNFEEVNNSNSIIGTIEVAINKSNFDNYKRTYQRLQSLLAEVMSVCSLLFEIGIQISNIIGDKKMSIDIMDYILNKKVIDNIKNHNTIKLYGIKNEIEKNLKKKNNTNIIDKEKINSNIIDKESNKDDFIIDEESKTSKSNIKMIKAKEIEEKDKILKKINYFDFLKSFLCFKDKRTELINYYHYMICQDISVEKILEIFYILDNLYKTFIHDKKERAVKKEKKLFKGKGKINKKILPKIKKEHNLND